MFRKSLLSFIILLLSVVSFSQKEPNIWYFGNLSGLDFNNSPPTLLTNGKIDTREGVAVMSDKNTGQLTFYTEGTTVWNRNHAVMPNGTGLLGDYSSTQSSIIVPNPGNANKYFIFTTAINTGFRYSEVDMSLGGGLGDIVTATKNQLLIANAISTEKLIAARHCNGKDFWVITHTANNNSFYVYLVNSLGIQPPVIFNIGSVLRKSFGDYELTGYLKLSPDASKLANAIGTNMDLSTSPVELFSFDNVSGIISGPVIQLTNLSSPYGIEFSPNEKLLYVSEIIGKRVNQYDLTAPNINASKLNLVSSSTLAYGALQLAPDGKIYVAAENGYTIPYNFLSTIAAPNVLGSGCTFQPNSVNLGITGALIGLPTFPATFLKDKSGYTHQGTCAGANVSFNITYSGNIDSVKWDFGDASAVSTTLNPTHVYSVANTYRSKLIIYRHCNTNDTLARDINIQSGFATALNASFCQGSTYKLPDGSIVSQAGVYPVMLRSTGGCDSMVTTTLNFAAAPTADLGKDTTVCTSGTQTITLGKSPSTPGNTYLWSSGATSPQITTAAVAGLYWQEITNAAGCKARDTIVIATATALPVNLGQDIAICNQQSVSLGSTVPGAASYLWSSGVAAPQITTNQPGTYWLEVTNANGCKNRDTVLVTSNKVAEFTLGADRGFCNGQSLSLGVAITGATYQWSNGANTPQINTTGAGLYWAEVSLSGCTKRDSVNISVNAAPTVVARSSNDIDCGTLGATLQASGAQTYIWTPALGLNDPTKPDPLATPAATTIYYLKGTDNNGCAGYDSVTVKVTSAGLGNFNVPNAFTPNGDGNNDCFGIKKWGAVELAEFSIYNRFGNKIFSTKNSGNCWDGTYKGKKQDPGGFVYIIRAKTFCGEFFKKGVVMLIR